MPMTVLGASPSSNSINQIFAEYAARQFSDELDIHRLTEFEMPLFTKDIEDEFGAPNAVKPFIEMLGKNELMLISFAENNGFVTTYYKNIIDWVSRSTKTFFAGTKVIALATSPSRTPPDKALTAGASYVEAFGGEVIGRFSLPSFDHYFDAADGINDPEYKAQFDAFITETRARIATL